MLSQIHFENLDASRRGLRRARLSIFAFFLILCFGAAKNAAALPAVSLSPTSLTFSSQAVGNAGAPQAITLHNTGNTALSITSIAITGVSVHDFTQTNTCGSSVAAAGKCTITVTFSPTATGARSAGVTLTDRAAGSPQTVSLAGTGTAAYASPSPTSVTFASQAVGVASAAQSVTLTNTGNSTLSISGVALTGANSSDFGQTNNCGTSLAAAAKCTISITFTPAASGTRTAAIAFHDSAYNTPQTVALTGTGAVPSAGLSPTTLTFASQAVGNAAAPQAITLSNTGSAALSITSIAITGVSINDFTQTNTCGSSLAAAGKCTITVTFSPTAIGARSAGVTVTDKAAGSPQTVSLAGTGTAAYASPSPSSLSFASQAIGTSSAAQAVTLTNTGNSTLSISGIALTGANSGDFGQTNNCGPSLAAAANCTISVTFTPAASGTRTAAIAFSDSAYNTPQTVALTGTGAAAGASLSPTSLTFASQAVGVASAAETITLSNTGNAALSITSIALTGTNASDFAQTNTCGTSVAAGSTCTVSVTFKPAASGTRTATVTFTDSANGGPQTASLTGTGAAPSAALSPTSLTFASQAVGVASAAETITLSNTGNAALSITSIALTGTNAGDFAQTNTCGTSVAAGSACTVSVTFKPAASGARTATVTFTDSANGGPQTASLTGTGAAPSASLSPTSVSFGTQLVGSTAAAQSVTLTNSGNAALSISSMAVSGTNASSFAQNSNCGGSVAAGGTCTIAVSFSPVTSGSLSASLTVVNGVTGNPMAVSLSGSGSTAAASLSAASLVFGSLPVGTSSPAQTVLLSNTGTSALSISGVAISGGSAGSFGQSNNCGTSLAAGANCAIGVTFSPSGTGALVATLTVADNASGSSQTVSLTGTGTTTASGQTINVVPTDNLQTLVNEYPGSTTFSLAPGMYRLQSVVPQTGNSFVGQTGATLSGAALLTTFVQNGSYWTAAVSVTQQASYPGSCLSTSPVCMYPEDLFFNNVLKTRVASVSAVGAGTWYLDYATQTAYIGDDPAGQTVEMSELPYAFSGGASNVTLSNLVVEKYAAVAQAGAIQTNGSGWTVEESEVRFNHGRGISVNSGMNITGSNVHHNGNLGIGGGGSNVTLSDNQISYNNASGYDWNWEAGGAKFAYITGLTVQNNNSFNNNGPGFWNDLNSETVTYTGNQTSGNIEAGIMIEISNGVTITNNTIVNDGFVAGESGLYYGAGILISTSSNVTISGNTVTNCMDGIGGIYSNRGNNPSGVPYSLSNVVASGNTITQGTGYAMGIVTEGTESGNTAVYTSMGNNFSGNTFVLTNPSTGSYFYWNGENMTLATWNSDVN